VDLSPRPRRRESCTQRRTEQMDTYVGFDSAWTASANGPEQYAQIPPIPAGVCKVLIPCGWSASTKA
jgi:hypothetical protein